jgi:hypothetical protein
MSGEFGEGGLDWRPPGTDHDTICMNCNRRRGHHRSGGGYCELGMNPHGSKFRPYVYGPRWPTAEEMYEALSRVDKEDPPQ